MGVLSFLSKAAIVAAIVIAGVMRFNQYEYSHFKIDRQDGKIILITGANSGLGYATAKSLAKAGATVVMGCRSQARCDEAKANIVNEIPDAHLDILLMDLSSFSSIRKAVTAFKAKYDHLDVLVNNAGIMMLPNREVTADGLEAQMGTNHFGHFLLTGLLFPILSQDGRIINHSSGAHFFAASDFVNQDLFSEKSYDPIVAYGNSKAANLLFTYELNHRLAKQEGKKNIVSVAVHPGYTSTNLQKDRFPFWELSNSLFAMNVDDGAISQIKGKLVVVAVVVYYLACLIAAAVDPNVKASDRNFFGPRFAMFGFPVDTSTSSSVWDRSAQEKLWEESVRITGENFGGI